MKIIFACLFLFALIFSANAQEKRLDSSPQDFRAFYSKFKNSVEKKNKVVIAAQTVFPFKYGFDTGDEGTLNKVSFLKSYDKKFAESLKEAVSEENRCLRKAKRAFTSFRPKMPRIWFL